MARGRALCADARAIGRPIDRSTARRTTVIRSVFRVALWVCAIYGAWILLGEVGLVALTAPPVSEIVEWLLGWAIEERSAPIF